MAFGLGVLCLPPEDFWGMTLKEMSAVIRSLGLQSSRPLDRSGLRMLMDAYPDRPKRRHANSVDVYIAGEV